METREDLEKEITNLRLNLKYFGGHRDGCMLPWGGHPCDCGWANVEQYLSRNGVVMDRKEVGNL